MKKIKTYENCCFDGDINIYDLNIYDWDTNKPIGTQRTYLIEIEGIYERVASIKLNFNDITKKGYLHTFKNLTPCPLNTTINHIEHFKNVAKEYFSDIEID